LVYVLPHRQSPMSRLIIPRSRDRGFKSRPRNQFAAVYFVYVLQNAAGIFYIGLTDDVPRRVSEHNGGKSRWTRGRGRWRLVWQSTTVALSEARKLENQLKRQKGGDGFYRLTNLPRAGS